MQYVKFVKILFVSVTKSSRNSWVTFLLFFACFCWSFASLAQEVVAGKHKGIYFTRSNLHKLIFRLQFTTFLQNKKRKLNVKYMLIIVPCIT